ncbi:hypothetical protein M2E15_2812 [Bacillus mycoides]|nr:hypothetical protein bmyco0001_23190 [Bacillus mycoides DSM 2048]KUH42716.1 hypothetical protein M2E15_2812 [Bacillus mycoides]
MLLIKNTRNTATFNDDNRFLNPLLFIYLIGLQGVLATRNK